VIKGKMKSIEIVGPVHKPIMPQFFQNAPYTEIGIPITQNPTKLTMDA
jgi:hypothetical protein